MKILFKISDLLIGKVLLWGCLASALIVFLGGLLFLIHHGGETHLNPALLQPEKPISFSFYAFLKGILALEAKTWIMLGIGILLFTQLVRVLLTIGYFIETKETIHAWTSFCVLVLLIFSISAGA